MQRGAPVETVIPWMHTQFKKYENEEVDQDNFIKSKSILNHKWEPQSALNHLKQGLTLCLTFSNDGE